MAGLDKEETITFISAMRDIFLRFGSTRLLGLLMILVFLGFMAQKDPANAPAYGGAGLLAFVAVAISLHSKPHLDRVPV